MGDEARTVHLTEREREVLKLRLSGDLTLKKVGERLGVTAERVRQIQNGGLRKLKRAGVLQ